MTLLLDTSVLIDIECNTKKSVDKLMELSQSDPSPAAISFITYFEFIHGMRLKSTKNKERSLAFIEKFYFLRPTKTTASILSDLKYKYDKLGKPIPLADLIIASQSIENNMTLVTSDRNFNEITELKKVIL